MVLVYKTGRYTICYIEDILVCFHQKADTTDKPLWKFERNLSIISSAACYQIFFEKSVKKVYNRKERDRWRFPELFQFFGISPQYRYRYHTAQSQSPCIMGGVMPLFRILFKGIFQRDFRPNFFHHSNLPGPLTNRLKYFQFWFRFRQVNQIFRKNLPTVSYFSSGYHTAGRHSWTPEVNSHL